MAGVWSWGSDSITGVTDSAGNTYTKVTSVRAPDQTEMSVWTAPITAGGGTRPTITVTAGGAGGIGAAAVEYANLSPASGTAAVDRFVTASGTAASTAFVGSGPTAAVTGDNALALGFYVDSGFSRSLLSDPAWTERVNVSPDLRHGVRGRGGQPLRGDTPNARVSTVANTPWSMATVVFKTGAPQPPSLAVVAGDPVVQLGRGRLEPGGQDDRRLERRRRLAVLDRVGDSFVAVGGARERHEHGHRDRDAEHERLGRGHVHDQRDDQRGRGRRLPEGRSR